MHPQWGAAGVPFERHYRPSYQDGTTTPRLEAKSGNPLPSPRTVSTKFHIYDPAIPKDIQWPVMFMQWGQFLDHDITATPVDDDGTATCCTDSVKNGALHADVHNGGPCFPIPIPEDDAYFGPKGVTCMEFRRSFNISNDPRQQQNVITAFVDGSQVYGSSPEEQAALRSGVNGQLKVSDGNNLPEDVDAYCTKVLDSDYCFLAGDDRVNVIPGLAALHTAFLRFHNQIASRIADTRHWSDEEIFQETRKIVAAVLQHITYSEYLPEVLGPEGARQYQLDDVDYHHDPFLNPGIYNSFAAAAYRFGHSTIVNSFVIDNIEIATEDLYFRPYYVLHKLKSLVEFLISNLSELRDRYFVDAITNKLFLTPTGSFDLVSRNIQRGRDHGLPTYNDAREHICGLNRIESFQSPVFRNYGDKLAEIYESVDDIDLYTGGVAEESIHTGTLGPTFSCIVGKQFHNLKFGDSFWYETKDHRRGFTPDQVDEIKKITLSRVLCNTIADFDSIQPRVMVPNNFPGNAPRSCSEIGDFNLDLLINPVPGHQQAEARPTQGTVHIRRPYRLNQGSRKPMGNR
ncbi:chorion peroxidase [Patella vulgata]|uniref:chorion peroxidase n=1 Tax=Patella vulgata TaxID=6465 RepID=UPI0024A8956D|nr:chorion peroxidase [Patella vulgata]